MTIFNSQLPTMNTIWETLFSCNEHYLESLFSYNEVTISYNEHIMYHNMKILFTMIDIKIGRIFLFITLNVKLLKTTVKKNQMFLPQYPF